MLMRTRSGFDRTFTQKWFLMKDGDKEVVALKKIASAFLEMAGRRKVLVKRHCAMVREGHVV
jgi:hypothetical protein